jgi:hypothetical protein
MMLAIDTNAIVMFAVIMGIAAAVLAVRRYNETEENPPHAPVSTVTVHDVGHDFSAMLWLLHGEHAPEDEALRQTLDAFPDVPHDVVARACAAARMEPVVLGAQLIARGCTVDRTVSLLVTYYPMTPDEWVSLLAPAAAHAIPSERCTWIYRTAMSATDQDEYDVETIGEFVPLFVELGCDAVEALAIVYRDADIPFMTVLENAPTQLSNEDAFRLVTLFKRDLTEIPVYSALREHGCSFDTLAAKMVALGLSPGHILENEFDDELGLSIIPAMDVGEVTDAFRTLTAAGCTPVTTLKALVETLEVPYLDLALYSAQGSLPAHDVITFLIDQYVEPHTVEKYLETNMIPLATRVELMNLWVDCAPPSSGAAVFAKG